MQFGQSLGERLLDSPSSSWACRGYSIHGDLLESRIYYVAPDLRGVLKIFPIHQQLQLSRSSFPSRTEIGSCEWNGLSTSTV